MLSHLKRLRRWYFYNGEQLFLLFKPIIGYENINELQKLTNCKYHWNHEFPILLIDISLETAILYWLYGYDTKKPIFFYHLVMYFIPEFFIKNSDIVYAAPIIATFSCHLLLSFDKVHHRKYILVKKQHNSHL